MLASFSCSNNWQHNVEFLESLHITHVDGTSYGIIEYENGVLVYVNDNAGALVASAGGYIDLGQDIKKQCGDPVSATRVVSL